MSNEQIKLTILNKTFTIGTPSSEKESLMAAVDLLNQKIELFQSNSKIADNEKIAIIAALNLTHDLTQRIHQLEQALNQIQPDSVAHSLADEANQRKMADLILQCQQALQTV